MQSSRVSRSLVVASMHPPDPCISLAGVVVDVLGSDDALLACTRVACEADSSSREGEEGERVELNESTNRNHDDERVRERGKRGGREMQQRKKTHAHTHIHVQQRTVCVQCSNTSSQPLTHRITGALRSRLPDSLVQARGSFSRSHSRSLADS